MASIDELKKAGYGLQVRKKQPVKVDPKKLAAFGDSDDEDPADTKKDAAEREYKKSKRMVQVEKTKAIAEDPSVYQYDEVYDSMQKKKDEKLKANKEADKDRKPKYMQSLMRAAKKRQVEFESRTERQEEVERVREGDIYADKEEFVTAAYKKKMEEIRLYEAEEQQRERVENMMEVTKQKDLSGFYRHFLNDQLLAGEVPIKTEPPDEEGAEHPPMVADPAAVIKEETVSDAAPVDRSLIKSKMHKSATVYRRKRSESKSPTPAPLLEPVEKPKHSIYSDEDDSSPEPFRAKEDTPPPQAGLYMPKKVRERVDARKKQEQEQADAERRRQREKDRLDRHDRRRSHSRSRSPSDKNGSKRKREKHRDATPPDELERPLTPKSKRLVKLREIFARHNDEASIDAYRQRYFDRVKLRNSG